MEHLGMSYVLVPTTPMHLLNICHQGNPSLPAPHRCCSHPRHSTLVGQRLCAQPLSLALQALRLLTAPERRLEERATWPGTVERRSKRRVQHRETSGWMKMKGFRCSRWIPSSSGGKQPRGSFGPRLRTSSAAIEVWSTDRPVTMPFVTRCQRQGWGLMSWM